jgi:hypothetical protein
MGRLGEARDDVEGGEGESWDVGAHRGRHSGGACRDD